MVFNDDGFMNQSVITLSIIVHLIEVHTSISPDFIKNMQAAKQFCWRILPEVWYITGGREGAGSTNSMKENKIRELTC